MVHQRKILPAALVIMSLLISAMFGSAGLGVLMSESTAPNAALVFGWVTLCYALVTTVMLVMSWLRPKTTFTNYFKYISSSFLAYLIIGSLDAGMISGHEWLLILFVGTLLWLQWYSVRKVVNESAK